jgi:hypothetical protein
MSLDLQNKRWIFVDLCFRVSVSSFSNLFQSFSNEQVSGLANLLWFTVYSWLWTFDELLQRKRRSFDDYLNFELEIRTKRSLKASGKFGPKINRCSSLFLLHWFRTCFDSLFFSLLLLWSCEFLEFVLELQFLRFDDDDSVVNLWELWWIYFNLA